MKKCIRCNQCKELSEYHKHGNSLYGECKICMNSRNAGRMMRNKLAAINAKGGCCERCGYDRNPKALEFHHKEPDKKDYTVAKLKNASLPKILKEIEKCLLLCSNCHKEVHDELWKKGNTINWSVYNDYLNQTQVDLRAKKVIYHCSCGKQVTGAKHKCRSCANKSQEKISWPSDEELKKLVWKIPRSTLAKQLGVSDKAIAKRCKLRGISQPSRGYWSKKQDRS